MKNRSKHEGNERQEEFELDVMCKGSGKPAMHTGGRLGVALQYWQERRHLAGRKRKSDEMDMDVDSSAETPAVEETPITWSATMDCEPSSADLYPSIRISSNWVTEATTTTAQQQEQDPFTTTLNTNDHTQYTWQDPPPSFLSSSDPSSAPDAMNLDTDTNVLLQHHPKTPDVRFVARFHPPVLVPLQTALNIYESVGAPLPQELIQPTTYDSLLLPHTDGTPSAPSTERAAERDIFVPSGDGGGRSRRHIYTLFTDPQAYARNVEDVPFSHPRQIVALLPVLRQWVMVSCLLRRCLVPSSKTADLANREANADDDDSADDDDDKDSANFTAEAELTRFLNPLSSSSSVGTKAKAIDISLSISGPAPRIRLTFERKGDICSVGFTVGANAGIEDVDVVFAGEGDNEGEEEGGEQMRRRREKVKEVLELGEDLGVLVEWMG
ncbi:MAG: hypothetical protein L6R39_006255 [Caloplaca ligustica]|nr:MAG: hypothetical protein L6R39_006255 [Caloplaca ligustica]